MLRILVNTISTKKITGGAFQIAINFILHTLSHPEIDWYYVTSQDLDDNIRNHFANLVGKKYFVYPTQPDFKDSYRRVKKELKQLESVIKPDIIYSITAPSYFSFKATEVMRFTNPWVVHPNRYAWSVLPIMQRVKTKLYCWNQKRLIKKVRFFITQTEATKNGIIRITHLPEENIAVVHNVLPAAFAGMNTTPITDDTWINFACIGTSLPHKNFDILPDVLKELHALGINNVRFHLTLQQDSSIWHNIKNRIENLRLSEHIVNHGHISQKELGLLYRKCQFCFLPTLLEVFSASTVEAMLYSLPIVATDFDFNKDVLADSCLYYEPKNAKDATKKIAQIISDEKLQRTLRDRMSIQLQKYNNFDKHFNAITDFLFQVAKNNNK